MTMANHCQLSYAEFLAIKSEMIDDLANAFVQKLNGMGDDIRGITWFSSCADEYAEARMPRAA